MPNATFKPHPFTQESRYIGAVPENKTLQEIVDDFDVPQHMKDWMVITINGARVPIDMWKFTTPKPDAHITILALPMGGGGDSGKNPLAIVAMIALTVVSGGAATALLAGTSIATNAVALGVAKAGIMMVGTMVINALFPPPSQPSPSNIGGAQFYTITGQSNRARTFEPIMRIYGKHKAFPDVAANPYVLSVGKEEYFYGLYCFGYGEIIVENIKIGNTDIGQYDEVDYRIHPNFVKGDLLEIYTDDVFQQPFNVTLQGKNADPFIINTTSTAQSAIIEYNWPLGLGQVSGSGNDRSVTVDLELRFRLKGDTVWIPLESLAPEFSTNVKWPDGKSAEIEHTHCEANENGTGECGIGLEQSTERLYVKAGATTLNMRARIQGGITLQAGLVMFLGGNGYTIVNTVTLGSAYQPVQIVEPLINDLSVYTLVINPIDSDRTFTQNQYPMPVSGRYRFTITRTTYTPFKLGVLVKLPFQGQWEIEVFRSDSYVQDNHKYRNETLLTGLKSIRHISPIAPEKPLTIMEIRIKASKQISGNIDTLSADCTSILDVFDGTNWNLEPTDNPAWIYADLLKGSANNRAAALSRIDGLVLKDWADYCDVPSNNDPSQPRFSCSFVNTGSTTVWELARNVCSSGRATPAVYDGKFGAIWDEKATIPVQVFTPRNSWGFAGSRTFIDQPHALRVTYVDAIAGYQQSEAIVYSDDYNEDGTGGKLVATLFENVILFGVVTYDQAWRMGRYYLAEGILRQETFKVNCDIENLICTRGDLVELSSDVGLIGGVASRIRALQDNGSNWILTADEPFKLTLPDPFNLRVRKLDGTVVTTGISAQISADTIITFGKPDIEVGDLFIYGKQNFVTDNYLIASIDPQQDLTATLTLVPQALDIYGADTGPLPDYDPIISPPLEVPLPDYPTSLTAIEVVTFETRHPTITVDLEWEMPEASPPWVGYNIYFRRSDEEDFDNDDLPIIVESDWVLAAIIQDATAFTFGHILTGEDRSALQIVGTTFDYKVIAFNAINNAPSFAGVGFIGVTIEGDTGLPDNITDLTVNSNSNVLTFAWKMPVGTVDLDGVQIRYSSDNTVTEWASGADLQAVNHLTTSISLPYAAGSYLFKTIDTSGNMAESTEILDIPVFVPDGADKIIWELDDAPLWNGIKDGVVVEAGALKLLPPISPAESTEGYYYFEDNPLLSLEGIYRPHFINTFSSLTGLVDNFVASWNPLSSVEIIAGDIPDGSTDVTIEGRTSLDGINWSQWRAFTGTDANAKHVEFRVRMQSFNNQVELFVPSAFITITLRNRSAIGKGLTAPITGLDVVFEYPFYEPPFVSVLNLEQERGDFPEVTAITRFGFHMLFINNNQEVQRLFDYDAIGVGEEIPLAQMPTLFKPNQVTQVRRRTV